MATEADGFAARRCGSADARRHRLLRESAVPTLRDGIDGQRRVTPTQLSYAMVAH